MQALSLISLEQVYYTKANKAFNDIYILREDVKV